MEMPSISKKPLEDNSNEVPILIRAYGEYWRTDYVNWEKAKPVINGTRNRSGQGNAIDIYQQRGVYVLYKDYVPVYVGKADNEPLGSRLRKQWGSLRRGNRWDTFSWFGIRTIFDQKVQGEMEGGEPVSSDVLIETLEAILILTINPLLNARRESFKNAERLYQSQDDRPKSEIEKKLDSIAEKLDGLDKKRG
jgi:hypothetical protein